MRVRGEGGAPAGWARPLCTLALAVYRKRAVSGGCAGLPRHCKGGAAIPHNHNHSRKSSHNRQ